MPTLPTKPAEQEIAELALDLVNFNTLEKDPSVITCIKKIIEYTGAEYVHVLKDGDTPVYMLSNTSEKVDFDVIMQGHVDIVPAHESQEGPKIEDGKIYGRGAGDMKGPIAAMAHAFKNTMNSGKKVALMLSSDEEKTTTAFSEVMRSIDIKAKAAFTPDSGSNWDIVSQAKGTLGVEFSMEGKGGHSAREYESVNAIRVFTEMEQFMREHFPIAVEGEFKTTAVPTIVNIGETQNVVPGSGSWRFHMRPIPGGRNEIEQRIAEFEAKLLEEKGVVLKKRITNDLPDYDAQTNSEPVQQWLDIISEQIGRRPNTVNWGGWCEAQLFAEKGMPVVVTRPPMAGAHGQNEWAETKGLLDMSEALQKWIAGIN